MNRREILALCGCSVAGITGCLSQTPQQGDDNTDTSTDGETDEPRTDAVTVDDIVVRKAVTYESTMGSGGVLAGDDRQYVVASVQADGDLRDAEFTFETEAESWQPGLPDTTGAINRTVEGHDGGPVGRSFGGDGTSYLAFAVPSPLSASNPRIRYEGPANADDGEWPIPDAERERLGADGPRFELDSLEVPEELSQGEQLSVSLTATNVSDSDGRFLSAVYWPTKQIADDDESHIVDREVPAGDDVTATREIDTRYTTYESEPVTLSVRGHVSAEREIAVEVDSA
ncbi:hypothetical protein [Halostella sp. PRR32]|uniref:hypothetical protein n=1 Tax=Halostella sp. PRR32 TaxID=3098147 RepID=UPI002B1E1379|nr:hypothetical protein [Halostella sp. PRR32]